MKSIWDSGTLTGCWIFYFYTGIGLSQCPIDMKRHHDENIFYKERHLIWAGLQFTGFVSDFHDRSEAAQGQTRHWRRSLRVLRLDPQSAERERATGPEWSF